MTKAPCKDCKHRKTACHDYCKRYKEWKILHKAENKKIYEIKEKERKTFEDKVERKKMFYGNGYWVK